MRLWIRSQDREMLRINPELEIYEDSNKDILVIDTKGSTDYYIAKILGKYKSKERALEVLDEIEERIMLINTINIAKDRDSLIAYKNALTEEKIKGLGYPYQMPKE